MLSFYPENALKQSDSSYPSGGLGCFEHLHLNFLRERYIIKFHIIPRIDEFSKGQTYLRQDIVTR